MLKDEHKAYTSAKDKSEKFCQTKCQTDTAEEPAPQVQHSTPYSKEQIVFRFSYLICTQTSSRICSLTKQQVDPPPPGSAPRHSFIFINQNTGATSVPKMNEQTPALCTTFYTKGTVYSSVKAKAVTSGQEVDNWA